MTDVLMPALSPTMEEGALAKWHVKVGDQVRAGDVIAEIETDKATMEIEAVDEGVVEALLVAEGTEDIRVNTPIARLKGDGDAAAPASPAIKEAPKKEAPKAAPGRADGSRTAEAKPPAARPPIPARQEGARVFASPLARRLAKEAGVDLAQAKGSGPHGRVIARDLENVRPTAPTPAAKAPAPEAPRAPSLEQLGVPPGSYDLVPLDSLRRTVARRTAEAFRDIPHFPLTIDLEIDALAAARSRINALLAPEGVRVSLNDLLIKAAAIALKRRPDVNVSFVEGAVARHRHADIAVAVAVPGGGLVTPIVRAAETKGVAEIAREMKSLAERARTRKLKPEEYQGGTFSISNLGMFGVRSFASILNPPQGAILSVGSGEKRPIVRGGEIAIATLMTVTLTCDHRVVDGAIGAGWLSTFKSLVEDPLAMIV